jgi:putative endonuclease
MNGRTRRYYVYILASRHHGTLYTGITSDIRARLELHRAGRGSECVKKYGVFRLVHVEVFASP